MEVGIMFQTQEQLSSYEAVVVAVFEGKDMSPFIKEIDDSLDGHITALLAEGEISAKKKSGVKGAYARKKTNVKRYYFVGLGKKRRGIRQRYCAILSSGYSKR
ncbi:hypothetical protein GCM10020331_029230 [Ectobacillus funiculus]